MRETKEQANSTRIIPSMVTHPTPININNLHVWRTLSSLIQYLASLKYSFLMSKTGHGHLGFDAQESPSKCVPGIFAGPTNAMPTSRIVIVFWDKRLFGGYQAIIFKLGQRPPNATSWCPINPHTPKQANTTFTRKTGNQLKSVVEHIGTCSHALLCESLVLVTKANKRGQTK